MPKILGIDYGTKNIGLAVSDTLQSQAFAYDTLRMSPKLLEEIKAICETEKIDKIVIGLPIGLSGNYSDKTEEVLQFIHILESTTKLIVDTEDERLSTVEAHKIQSGHQIDEASAQIILQQYLDRNHNY